MLQITKIFRFETAHAIHGYEGMCRHIHGHSYELHVTVAGRADVQESIPAPGFVIDFKELKRVVNKVVVVEFDHKTILSKRYLLAKPELFLLENLVEWDAEPSAENILLYTKRELEKELPADVKLTRLKLYETADSYAEWSCG